jgi:erythromycin esterase
MLFTNKIMKTFDWFYHRLISKIIFFLIVLIVGFNFQCKKIEDKSPETIWLNEQALNIPSSDINIEDIDFTEIDKAIGSARIIGLGEANHGTTEFWGIRYKLTKHLIEEKGFKAVLFEAIYPNSLFLYDYLVNDYGTLNEAHEKLGTWRFREMQDLLKMLKAHNENNPNNKVSFYGYDCAFPKWEGASEQIVNYLREVDNLAIEDISLHLTEPTEENAEYVFNCFNSGRNEYISHSSLKEFRRIYLIARNLSPSVKHKYLISNGLNALNYRDEINVNNVEYLIDSLLDGEKVIIWAHNVHISNGITLDFDQSWARTVGSRLTELYGKNYFKIATEFYNGTFMAWDECDGHDYVFKIVDVKPPADEYYAHYFYSCDYPVFFLNFRDIDYNNPNAAWLKENKKFRVIGATYCIEKDTGTYYSQYLKIDDYFDALFFFKDCNPITQIEF